MATGKTLVLMSEDDRDAEASELSSEALIALLQQHPGAIVTVGAYGGMGALVAVIDNATEGS